MNTTFPNFDTGTAPASDRSVEVRPTVFVAVGGTGMEIALRLRRRILQADWNGSRLSTLADFPPAAFLYFDTDTNTPVESNKSKRQDPLSELVAFGPKEAIQNKVDLVYYRDEARHKPNIADWMPATDLSRINAEHGAGQVRAISRLLFFQEFGHVRNSLIDCGQRVLQNVSNEGQLKRLGLDVQSNSLRVVVIASVAGGTGSGAFIDMGYLASGLRLAPQSDVDLFLLLPGGFQGANRNRVFANGYAALSELEFCMRGDRRAPYVGRWTENDRPEGIERPFKDVYLIDNKNVAGELTGDRDVVFDMVADILFEDFGNSDFARRKRSIGVNQQQFKMRPYAPKVGAGEQETTLSYYKGYSSVGQSTINTTTALEYDKSVTEVTWGMIAAFFGVLATDRQNAVRAEERDGFLRSHLHLESTACQDIPPIGPDRIEHAVAEYALVDRLLLREDNTRIDGSLMLEIERDIDRVKHEFAEHADWSREVERVYDRRQVDVDGRPGQQVAYGPLGDEIRKNRERIEAELLGEGENGLPALLYRYVDDHERGGLDYTISLIEDVVRALRDPAVGAAAKLREAQARYAKLANDTLDQNYVASLKRLYEASQKRLFSFGGGRTMAEEYIGHAQIDIGAILRLRLRAIACREALVLLDTVCDRLGAPQGTDAATGERKGSGLVGEFLSGRATVQRLLGNVRAQIERVEDIIRRPDGGTYFTVPDRRFEIDTSSDDLLEWGREAFKGEGGSRGLFKRLQDDKEQARIINMVLEESNRRLVRYLPKIGSCTDALRALPEDARRDLFRRMVQRAMPWIDAKFDRDELKIGEEQYKLVVAVNDKAEFQREFGSLVNTCLPSRVGIKTVGFEETSVRGKIVCYCELSGIPLDVVDPLRSEWRRAYDEEMRRPDAIPLHNHRDYEQFPAPVVPKSEELARQRAEIALYLKGVLLGLMSRSDDGDWRIQMRPNDWHRAGTEKKIRRSNFMLSQQEKLREQVRVVEDRLTSSQLLAMAALARWTADRVYAPRRVEIDKREIRIGGLPNSVAEDLCRDYLAKFERRYPKFEPPETVEQAIWSLIDGDALDAWTEVVRGSAEETDPNEVERDGEPGQKATDKRRIDARRFTPETIEGLLRPGTTAPTPQPTAIPAASVAAPPPPPPPSNGRRFWVHTAAGGVVGPFDGGRLAEMAIAGTLARDTRVCAEGTTTWLRADETAELGAVFGAAAGSPPPPPPPPLG
ncbi:MAG: DUF4339 domain-containing protein [Phyllobacteriaceae bacterium]|nr:DUF4339 domain-containing protein [Phyllobacteriaceae bacterium]